MPISFSGDIVTLNPVVCRHPHTWCCPGKSLRHADRTLQPPSIVQGGSSRCATHPQADVPQRFG
jgi:hypothetical protein